MTRDDLLLGPEGVRLFYSGCVVEIQEKVDGANLGVSLGPDYSLRFQNRSHFVSSSSATQWKGLETLEARHGAELRMLLLSDPLGEGDDQDLPPGRLVLYGEWMPALHSVHYDKLPGYFLVFDLFDRLHGRFYSRKRLRAHLRRHTTLPLTPRVCRIPLAGPETLRPLLDSPSQFRRDGGYLEGVYLRIDDGDWLKLRAKLVRPDFIQNINEGVHWTQQMGRSNQVLYDPSFGADEEDDEADAAAHASIAGKAPTTKAAVTGANGGRGGGGSGGSRGMGRGRGRRRGNATSRVQTGNW